MISRILSEIACSKEWGRQMRFIAGPRQCGKTTLAKMYLARKGDSDFYYNWDRREMRLRYSQSSRFLEEDLIKARSKAKRWVCFDEIHKIPKWKNVLKDQFDAFEKKLNFIVTGSARLDLFRRSGDSLAGRYFLFHLFPLNLFEITRKSNQSFPFDDSANQFIENRIERSKKNYQSSMRHLLEFGGFPEPFLKGNKRFHRIWKQDFLDRLVREDLRDLTRIAELENVVTLMNLLPSRMGSPLSINSLREDLLVSHETIQNYLRALRLCYGVFELSTFTRKINRALKKEKKVYFYDWSRLEDEGIRFENYVAVELLTWISSWHDAGRGSYELRYVKTRNQKECDFVIVKNGKPWLLLEAKVKDQRISSHLHHFSDILGKIPIVQLVQQEGVLKIRRQGIYSVSASRFFGA